MLKENPQKRPNIYEVLREACHMQGKECPIKDVRRPSLRVELRILTVIDLRQSLYIRSSSVPGTATFSHRSAADRSGVLPSCSGDANHP